MYGEGLVVEEVCRPPDESQGVKEVLACLLAVEVDGYHASACRTESRLRACPRAES